MNFSVMKKGSHWTHDSRKGYFEVANEGTIFLDEVSRITDDYSSKIT